MLAVVVAGCSVILGTAVPASAAVRPTPPPPDVQHMFDTDAPKQVQKAAADFRAADSAPATADSGPATADSGPASADSARIVPSKAGDAFPKAPDFSGVIRTTSVHEVFDFSPAFLAGQSGGESVTSKGQWIGVIERNAQPLGTVTLGKRAGAAAQVDAFDGDVELASALRTLSADQIFIRDSRTEEWFGLSGDTVTPLNQRAKAELPSAAPISALRTVVAARIAAVNQQAVGVDAPVGGGGPVATVQSPTENGLTGPMALFGYGLVLVGAGMGAYALRAVRRQRPVLIQPQD